MLLQKLMGLTKKKIMKKPLDNKGKIDCMNLSDWLKKSFLDFDLVISSNANRALQTSRLVFEPLNISIQQNALFYLCSYEEIFKSIKSLDDNISNVVVVGHEPSMSETLRELVGSTRPDLRNFLKSSYLPCTISFIHCNKKYWKQIEKGDGLLEAYMSPKILKDHYEED